MVLVVIGTSNNEDSSIEQIDLPMTRFKKLNHNNTDCARQAISQSKLLSMVNISSYVIVCRKS